MRSVQSRLHLIWADRIVLWLAIGVLAAAAICWCLVAVAAGAPGADHVVMRFAADSGAVVIMGLLTLWTALRAMDFIARGATTRLVHRDDAPKPASTPRPTGKPMATA